MPLTINWDELLRIFLHDPPDKVLSIGSHEARTKRYLRTAIGDGFDDGTLKKLVEKADLLVAIAERPPMPGDGRCEVD